MPTFKYKKTKGQGDFVDMQQNTPTTPRKDKYDVGETEDVTGASMIAPLPAKKLAKVREVYHASKGRMGIVNKALGGRFGPY